MKIEKKWLAALLLSLSGLSNAGCLGPKITVCVSDPEMLGFQCHNQKTNEDYFVRYDAIGVPPTPNYVSMPVRDYEKLLKFIKDKCN